MAHSMTGFGRGVARTKTAKYVAGVRSVNNRFCEVRVQAPRTFLELEHKIAARIRERFERGKFDVTLRVERVARGETDGLSDSLILRRYRDLERLRRKLKIAEPLKMETLLSTFRREPDENGGEGTKPLEKAVDQALARLKDFRKREGDRLVRDIRKRTALMLRLVETVTAESKEAAQRKFQKLKDRVSQLLDGRTPEPGRMELELALLADKADITEELVRLASHLKDLGDSLASGGSVGRKIDFLLQEIHREVNTAGAKLTEPAVTAAVVELKAEIERIREQSQNLE